MLVLVTIFSYTPSAGFSEELLWYFLGWFQWGVLLTLLKLAYIEEFPYTPDASFFEEVSFDSSRDFQEGVSYTFLLLIQFNEEFMLCLFVRSFSYIPDATFSEEFLLHISGCVYLWGVSLTHLMLYLFVRSFSYTPDAMFIREKFLLYSTFSEEFLLPCSC